jgi:hypothetical protein
MNNKYIDNHRHTQKTHVYTHFVLGTMSIGMHTPVHINRRLLKSSKLPNILYTIEYIQIKMGPRIHLLIR